MKRGIKDEKVPEMKENYDKLQNWTNADVQAGLKARRDLLKKIMKMIDDADFRNLDGETSRCKAEYALLKADAALSGIYQECEEAF